MRDTVDTVGMHDTDVDTPLMESSNEIANGEGNLNEDAAHANIINRNYKFRHLIAFNLTGFFCISFVIFLTSSQPFYITQILSVETTKLGKVIGALGVVDELTSIITSPLIGSLADKINHSRWVLNGTKFVVMLGFVFIWISFSFYGLIPFKNWSQLIVPRILFAMGVTSCMSMVPVLLQQVIYSDFKFTEHLFWKFKGLTSESGDHFTNINNNGRYSAMVGISTGLGAIFSVSFFLTLPVRLLNDFDFSSSTSLKFSFVSIGAVSLLVSVLTLLFLYNNGETQIDRPIARRSYFKLLSTGFYRFKSNSSVRLACIGGFVARSTSVMIAVFVPLFVYNFYHKSGLCDSDGSLSKENCYDGYTFAAILTGVAQTVSLLSSPVWGVLCDRFGREFCLILSSVVGLLGNWLVCILNLYDPRNATCFILISLIGLSQIGTVITSMTFISAENDAVGSLSGIYNLCGGVGILLLSQFGGIWSDFWSLGPFFLMGSFNLVLIIVAFLQVYKKR